MTGDDFACYDDENETQMNTKGDTRAFGELLLLPTTTATYERGRSDAPSN